MWELDHKGGWAPKSWCFWTVVLEKTLESPLNCKEIKSVDPKGNQPWIFIGRTAVEAEALVIWPIESAHWKDPDAGKDWRQKEKGVTENEKGSIIDSMDINMSKLQETVQDRRTLYAGVHGVTNSRIWLSSWTTTMPQ